MTAGPGSLDGAGEFSVIDRILAAAREVGDATVERHPAVVVGPGDDAAVVRIEHQVVCSTDAMIEGVHFRRDWSSATDVGHKLVASTVADIEAMGARPVGITVALSAPSELETTWVDDLARGIAAECAEAGISLLGGDLSVGPVIGLVGTALGDLPAGGPAVTRAGARVGQTVAVCGRLGWAAAGLRTLSRGFRSPRAVVEAQRRPQPPYGKGAQGAAAGATAMIDVSDGLLADLGHVARASAVSIELDSDAFDLPDPIRAVAAATGGDPLDLVLSGGEDHALAATFDVVPDGWTAVGRVVACGEDGPTVLVDGTARDVPVGHDHFGARGGVRPGSRR